MWISATQLELMILGLPNTSESGPYPHAVFQPYDEAWLNNQTEDICIAGFYVYFYNTRSVWRGWTAWTVWADKRLMETESLLDTIRALPHVDSVEAESGLFGARSIQFSKGTYTGPDGRPYTDWSINMRNMQCTSQKPK